jgi:hypothetical protein
MTQLKDIADVVHKGVAFRWKNKNFYDLMNDSQLPQDVNAFLDTLQSAGVDYMIVGGIALLQYIEARNTEVIDVILSLTDSDKIQGLVLEEVNEFSARGKFGLLTVDILRSESPFFRYVQERHGVDGFFLNRSLHTASAKGLALLKLYALPSLYRQHQHTRVHIYEADLQSLILHGQFKNEELLSELIDFMSPNDIHELSKILVEFEQHRSRFS